MNEPPTGYLYSDPNGQFTERFVRPNQKWPEYRTKGWTETPLYAAPPAAQQQEPVAYMYTRKDLSPALSVEPIPALRGSPLDTETPLYSAPPAAQEMSVAWRFGYAQAKEEEPELELEAVRRFWQRHTQSNVDRMTIEDMHAEAEEKADD